MESMNIVERYSRDRPRYELFCLEVSDLIDKLIKREGLSVHSISKRCKTVESLRGKIERKQTYELLEDVTDLVGIRVITNYSTDVDEIAALIRSEFVVDWDKTVDKRTTIDPNQFGYLSLHYIVSLNPERAALKEYRDYAGIKFEIQMRSILQHAWAEIEHDIGYKSVIEVPRNVSRAFSRLAGLLELADEEFDSIRKKIREYKDFVEQTAKSGSNKLPLDKESFTYFVETNKVVARIDQFIADSFGMPLGVVGYTDGAVARLNAVNISDLESLERLLVENEGAIHIRTEQVKEQIPPAAVFRPLKGLSIVFLTQVLAAKSEDSNLIDKFVGATTKAVGFKEVLMELRARLQAS